MKNKSLIPILLFSFLSAVSFAQTDETIHTIYQHGRWGFIDDQGLGLINPRFRAAQDFSEGLAAVRVNGTYGYINDKGKFVIEPQFDYATSFKDGQARVFINGKPYYIDKSGHKKFDHNYVNIQADGKYRYYVVTKGQHMGVLDAKGNILVDTVYSKISGFNNGLATVALGLRGQEPGYGVVDTLGQWVVQMGKYYNISEYKNGYADVEFQDVDAGNDHLKGCIDKTGKLLFKEDMGKWHLDWINEEGFYEGYRQISIYAVDPSTIHSWSSSDTNEYAGFINTQGKVIASNRHWREMTPFCHGRAFAKQYSDLWIMIDTLGHQVGDKQFTNIMYSSYEHDDPVYMFYKDVAYVEYNRHWVGIDKAGNVVVTPGFKEGYEHFRRIKNIIIFNIDVSEQDEYHPFLYGFYNADDNKLVEPEYVTFDYTAIGTGHLIYTVKNGLICYINENNGKVWSEDKSDVEDNEKDTLNIDVKNRAYFFAYSSKEHDDLNGYGGWAKSDNVALPIPDSLHPKADTLQLHIDDKHNYFWYNKFYGYQMYLTNTSKQNYYLPASDDFVYINLQAKDKDGNWRDIEYIPRSTDGNSYHTVCLEPNEYWKFGLPLYQGQMKTMVRAHLVYTDSAKGDPKDLYSNSIPASINPAQFWRKMGHHATDMMDPYEE